MPIANEACCILSRYQQQFYDCCTVYLSLLMSVSFISFSLREVVSASNFRHTLALGRACSLDMFELKKGKIDGIELPTSISLDYQNSSRMKWKESQPRNLEVCHWLTR